MGPYTDQHDYLNHPVIPGVHEYPDPEFVPRYPWLGTQDHGASTEDLEHDLHSARPILGEESVQHDQDTQKPEPYVERLAQDRSPDPDYNYREDSAK